MQTNRRDWLKQTGLLLAGLGISPIGTFAAPEASLPSEQVKDKTIRLCFNENPYGPSPAVRKAVAEQISASNRYPWQITEELADALGGHHMLAEDHVFLSSGSTEILDLVVQWAAREKGSFVLADPTFSFWAKRAEYLGLQKISVPLTAEKKHDLEAMKKAVRPDTRLVYVCNPNNPTGTIIDYDALAAFIASVAPQTIVLLDEAYLDYTKERSQSVLVSEFPNLVIARTFSKIHGLAGARIGYALAHPDTIATLKQMLSWPGGGVGLLSATAALTSLKDIEFIRSSFEQNREVRNDTQQQLRALGLNYIPSYTNFIYFSLERYKKDFFAQLKNKGIMGTHVFEEKGKWTRITVGSRDEMKAFISAL